MTLAILLISDPASGTADPALEFTLSSGQRVADRLADQLRAAGARQVRVSADLAAVAALAEEAREPVLVCAADLVAHTAVLRHLATHPVTGTVALVLGEGSDGGVPVREERGQVVAVDADAGNPASLPGTFGGALRVSVADLPALAAAARAGASPSVPTARRPEEDPVASSTAAASPTATMSAVDRLLAALVGTGTPITAHRVRLLVARRVTDPAAATAAEAAVAAVDSDAAELRLAVKEKDDFFTTFFVSTWSPWVTRAAARLNLSPTGVTAISVLFAVVAAVLFGVGGRPAQVTGAVLLYLGFVLDCVDGQLARYTRQFSPWGGWLDTMADRAKEYVVYAGLAVGVDQAGLGNGWALAISAMVLQTVRHMTDTWYGVLHDEAARRPRPPATGGGRPAGGGGLGERLSRASTRVQADTGSVSYWLKRTVVFPIGERWALIALTVALFGPLVSLVAVLTWGGLAAAYTLALRSVRARSMRVSVLAGTDTALHRDDGPLARWLGRQRAGRLAPLPMAGIAVAASVALLGAALTGRLDDSGTWALPLAALGVLLAALAAGAPHGGPLDWLVPAALRAAEYLLVIGVGVATEVPVPVTFGLLFVIALRHYDLTARLEKRQGAPRLRAFGLGWDGRVSLLVVVAMAGFATVGMAVLGAYLLVLLAATASAGWAAALRAERRAVAGPATAAATDGTAVGSGAAGDVNFGSGASGGSGVSGGSGRTGLVNAGNVEER